MKKVMLSILIMTILLIRLFSDQTEDKGKFNKISTYDLTKILYWTSYGTTATFGFINSFAYLGYSSKISEDMKVIASDIKKLGTDMQYFRNTADALPYIYFGTHFVLAGFSFIPYYGGLVYGSVLYLSGILTAIIRVFNPIDMFWRYEVPTNLATSYIDRLSDIHKRMFDPTSYFVLGTFAIIFGVCEIVAYHFYRKQINKMKYPLMHKILTLSPDGTIIIKINI